MADTLALGASVERRVGSSPTWGTIKQGWHIGCVPAFQAGQRSSILLPCSSIASLAQLVVAAPLHGDGRGFESLLHYQQRASG